MSEREDQLEGGRVSEVTRVGDTVRRPRRPWSETTQQLLAHLSANGFPGVPEPRGFDTVGREILTFIEGQVGTGVPESFVWRNETLIEVGRMLRSMHDASVGFVSRRDVVWQTIEPAPARPEVICHNDVAPWNTVFRNERPVAFIDWDWAQPGRRLDDLAYAMWHFVPLYGEQKCLQVGSASPMGDWRSRTRLICRGYGVAFTRDVLKAVVARQTSTLRGIEHMANQGVAAYQRLIAEGAGDGIMSERRFVQDNMDALLEDP